MSTKLPVFTGKELIKLFESLGFIVVRINGSHHRLRHPDGRVTTVPVHKSQETPKGLMRKIIREDLDLELEQFVSIVTKLKK